MMRRIIATSLRFRFIVVALAAGMMLIGAAQVRAMPVDVFPEFAPPKVEIQTICIGLSAEEVEQLVTVPIEQALAGIEGLETIRSKSVIQLSQVVLLFKPGTNELQARQLVAERLAQIIPSLPTWAAPPVMLQPLSATSRVMKIGMSSEDVSQIDMSMISYWTIRPRLLSVPGVANIAIWGEQLHMLQVQAIPIEDDRARRRPHGCHGCRLRDPGRRDPAVQRRQLHGHRRVRRHPESTARHPPHPAGRRGRRSRPRHGPWPRR